MHRGLDSRGRGILPRLTRGILASVERRETAVFVFVMMVTASLMAPVALGIFGGDEADTELVMEVSATGTPPTFEGTSPPATITVSPGISKIIFVRVKDVDGDNVNVTWNFGDGTPTVVNMTAPATLQQTVYIEHTWNPEIEQGVGGGYIEYTLNITIDDGNGNYAYRTSTVQCYLPENYGPQSDIIAPAKVDPNDLVLITAMANDTEGEPLTWTFVFNNSGSTFLTLVYNTPATEPATWQWRNITYTFGVEGNFEVTLYVSDALGANQTGLHNTSDSAAIESYENKVPYLTNITVTPLTPIINETGYINVTYSIEILDVEGEIMNVTWDVGDGSPLRYNESGAQKIVYIIQQWVNYTVTGEFNVSVVVTDGRPGHEVYKWTMIFVNSTNLPPSVTGFSYVYSQGSFELPNVAISFTVNITDPELDLVRVTVSWGDGSPYEYYNLTEFVEGNVTLHLSHAFSSVGNYHIEIWYTDNKSGLLNHSKYYNLTVKVEIPPPIIVKKWSWWDYTSLALFAMIPVLVVLRLMYVARQRRVIEAQGMTLEEYRLIQSERVKQEEEALERELARQAEGTKR